MTDYQNLTLAVRCKLKGGLLWVYNSTGAD